ncbi:MAG: penicillin-insensitive murein endopeptidase, partial [Alphaproteobacteria bacterium]|nr:penicillin-insensitive murein endopeptidase [Alphaproteobacteria bacterium]
MHAAAAIATVMTGMLLSVPVNAASWSDPTIAPTAGPAQVIGRPWNGCLAGAVSLPWDGPGFEVLRPAEHRYYGHPETVGFVERLGREAHAAGLPNFYVGDMAQPRGGPMSSNHVSHETGIDVDIWFTLDTVPGLPVADRTTLEPPPMVLADQSAIDPAQFGPHQVTLLRLAASDPLVDRIFVNPAIKEALCHGYGGAGQGDRTWLERVRPWYGHKAHFHVRLKCPPGS